MTNEELIEKVAAAFYKSHALPYSQRSEWDKQPYREQARAVTKIVGEACAHLCTSKVPHYSTNELIDAATGGRHTGTVYADAIKFLTQGTKQ